MSLFDPDSAELAWSATPLSQRAVDLWEDHRGVVPTPSERDMAALVVHWLARDQQAMEELDRMKQGDPTATIVPECRGDGA